MRCRITDMHNKEVINICDGNRIGFVDDVEVDTVTAEVVAIVINGRPKCLGLFGREEDFIILWKDIEVIGEETILVNCKLPPRHPCKCKRHGLMSGIFGGPC